MKIFRRWSRERKNQLRKAQVREDIRRKSEEEHAYRQRATVAAEKDLEAQNRMANAAIDSVEETRKGNRLQKCVIRISAIAASITFLAVIIAMTATWITQDFYRKELRPWISFELIPIDLPEADDNNWEFAATETFRNFGKTPATRIIAGMRLVPQIEPWPISLMSDPIESSKLVDEACDTVRNFVRTDNPDLKTQYWNVQDIPDVFPGSKPVTITTNMQIWPADLPKDMKEGSCITISLIGCIKYESIDGDEGVTKMASDITIADRCDVPPLGLTLKTERKVDLRCLSRYPSAVLRNGEKRLCVRPNVGIPDSLK